MCIRDRLTTIGWQRQGNTTYLLEGSVFMGGATVQGLRDGLGLIATLDGDLLGAPIALAGMAGDQQAATYGQACLEPGMAKNTYGTGCFLLMNTGSQAMNSTHRMLTTIGWRRQGQTTYPVSYTHLDVYKRQDPHRSHPP